MKREEEIGLDDELPPEPAPGTDPRQPETEAVLTEFFDAQQERVFFSKQVEVLHENDFYHWLTNRALKALALKGILRTESRNLIIGSPIHLYWHRRNRYYKRSAAALVALVNEYADPNVGAALGLHGESMVLGGFARSQFVWKAQHLKSYGGLNWEDTGHTLDFVFERDGLAYGIEVKNTIKYMNESEFETKIRMSQYLGLTPVFVCRMLPRPWILKLASAGGFALILKWQLYPWTHTQLARRVHDELGLPVDSPRQLADATMERFERWHRRRL